jgi:phosphoribulokinase
VSEKHPIIAVTGSSGAGTTSAKRVFERIFESLDLTAAYVDGDSFHMYDREQMRKNVERARIRGELLREAGKAVS